MMSKSRKKDSDERPTMTASEMGKRRWTNTTKAQRVAMMAAASKKRWAAKKKVDTKIA